MPESKAHKDAKVKAAGRTGKTEVIIKGGKRLDAATKVRAIEVERSGTRAGLVSAAKRLSVSRKPQKVLQVPQKDFKLATEAMRKVEVSGTVKNMSGTKTAYVGVVKGKPAHRSNSVKK